MLIFQSAPVRSRGNGCFRVILSSHIFRRRPAASRETEYNFSSPTCTCDVLQLGIVSDGEVRGQRPGRRRPDDDERVRLADDGKFHEHALADVVVIFDFGLGQRGAAGNAPIHRLFAAIDKALFHDVGEQPQFVRLVFLVQREIRIFPIAEDAEALELRALEVNVFAGVGFAGFADGRRHRRWCRRPCAFPARL